MEAVVSIVDDEDVLNIVRTQRKTLRKYEEINELIRRFNDVAEKTYQDAHIRFGNHVKLLTSLKKDLDVIFRRIRFLKEKLQTKYPQSFEATADAIKSLMESYCIDNEDEPTRAHSAVTDDEDLSSTNSQEFDESVCAENKETDRINHETDITNEKLTVSEDTIVAEIEKDDTEDAAVDPIGLESPRNLQISNVIFVEDAETASD